MKMLKQNKTMLTVIFSIIVVIIIFGIILYNNQFYAKRVISAIEQENIPKLQKLLESPLGNLNCKPTLWIYEVLSEKSEPTPLQAACKSGNTEIVKLLLENGAKVNYTHWDKSRNQGDR